MTPSNFKQEIPELMWLSYKELRELITFENDKEFFDQRLQYLDAGH